MNNPRKIIIICTHFISNHFLIKCQKCRLSPFLIPYSSAYLLQLYFFKHSLPLTGDGLLSYDHNYDKARLCCKKPHYWATSKGCRSATVVNAQIQCSLWMLLIERNGQESCASVFGKRCKIEHVNNET